MRTLWENYSGSDLELRKYKSRISDSILQPMHAGWYPGLWRERAMKNKKVRDYLYFNENHHFFSGSRG